MATIWLTYAWDDNKDGDIDYIAQKLEKAGITVKLDRWNISAGERLWDQIGTFITDPNECDAWLFVATTNSLQSEACKEEFAYALDRAINDRNKNFPIITLFTGPVDNNLIKPAIKIRLHVSITDPDWTERIKAAAEGRTHSTTKPEIKPYHIKIHTDQATAIEVPMYPGVSKPKKTMQLTQEYAIEVRPRVGVWGPFVAAILFSEKDSVNPNIMVGHRDKPTNNGMLQLGISQQGDLWAMFSEEQATPTRSYYVWCDSLPTSLTFGVEGSQVYTVDPRQHMT